MGAAFFITEAMASISKPPQIVSLLERQTLESPRARLICFPPNIPEPAIVATEFDGISKELFTFIRTVKSPLLLSNSISQMLPTLNPLIYTGLLVVRPSTSSYII